MPADFLWSSILHLALFWAGCFFLAYCKLDQRTYCQWRQILHTGSRNNSKKIKFLRDSFDETQLVGSFFLALTPEGSSDVPYLGWISRGSGTSGHTIVAFSAPKWYIIGEHLWLQLEKWWSYSWLSLLLHLLSQVAEKCQSNILNWHSIQPYKK